MEQEIHMSIDYSLSSASRELMSMRPIDIEQNWRNSDVSVQLDIKITTICLKILSASLQEMQQDLCRLQNRCFLESIKSPFYAQLREQLVGAESRYKITVEENLPMEMALNIKLTKLERLIEEEFVPADQSLAPQIKLVEESASKEEADTANDEVADHSALGDRKAALKRERDIVGIEEGTLAKRAKNDKTVQNDIEEGVPQAEPATDAVFASPSKKKVRKKRKTILESYPLYPKRGRVKGVLAKICATTNSFERFQNSLRNLKKESFEVVAPGSKWAPLHLLMKKGDSRFIEELLKYNPDVNALAQNGWNALHLAALYLPKEVSQEEVNRIVNLLVAKGIDLNGVRSGDLPSPVHVATHFGNAKLLRALVEAKADFLKLDSRGYAPLHYAIIKDAEEYRESTRFLLSQKGIDVNVMSACQDPCPPLIWAAYLGNRGVFEILKSFPGVDLDRRDLSGKSYRDYFKD